MPTAPRISARAPRGEVLAYTFVADPSHPQYAGQLSIEEAAQIIIRARGRAGLNRDYLIETVRRMEAEGSRTSACTSC